MSAGAQGVGRGGGRRGAGGTGCGNHGPTDDRVPGTNGRPAGPWPWDGPFGRAVSLPPLSARRAETRAQRPSAERAPLPPNLGLSRQFRHVPQSSRQHASHWPQATCRRTGGSRYLSIGGPACNPSSAHWRAAACGAGSLNCQASPRGREDRPARDGSPCACAFWR